MEKKTALVLDTNFVFAEASQMDKLLEQLKTSCDVYISQISVDERKEQRCREFEKRYSDYKQFSYDFRYVVDFEKELDCGEALKKLREGMQKKYELSFPNCIIPLSSSKDLLEKVLDRANKKIPPFSGDDKASDKGFKDTLIWLSILDYFSNNNDFDVVFLTNDAGFLKNSNVLCCEFNSYTGGIISIQDNGYYKSLVEPKPESENNKQEPPLQDFAQLREKIHHVIYSMCTVEVEGYWGDTEWSNTFTLNEKVDTYYMETVFSGLKSTLKENIFEMTIPAEKVLGLDGRITNIVPIPMVVLENTLALYEEIKKNLPDYLNQFYSTAATIINDNFIVPLEFDEEDGKLPF